jgi:short-subunit dehydrogenase involved in D-alanine esterification of teichoic acids
MKKIFIVGGTSGFGLSLAKKFHPDHEVTVCGRKKFSFFNSIICDSLEIKEELFNQYEPNIIINNSFDKKDYIKSYAGSLNVLKTAFNYFKNRDEGIIINVNSISGICPDPKEYSDSIAAESFQRNIKIINLYPRAMATGMNLGRSDFKDLIDPNEVAEFVVMMTKTKSFYISSIQFDRIKR